VGAGADVPKPLSGYWRAGVWLALVLPAPLMRMSQHPSTLGALPRSPLPEVSRSGCQAPLYHLCLLKNDPPSAVTPTALPLGARRVVRRWSEDYPRVRSMSIPIGNLFGHTRANP